MSLVNVDDCGGVFSVLDGILRVVLAFSLMLAIVGLCINPKLILPKTTALSDLLVDGKLSGCRDVTALVVLDASVFGIVVVEEVVSTFIAVVPVLDLLVGFPVLDEFLSTVPCFEILNKY